MHKLNIVFVKDVYVLTDCIGKRNISCRGTGPEIMMNRRYRVFPDRLRRIT
jgi:hypothetical protein